MKKVLVFEEGETYKLFLKFRDSFLEQSKKGWGVKLLSNETNSVIDDIDRITGSLFIVWNKIFGEDK